MKHFTVFVFIFSQQFSYAQEKTILLSSLKKPVEIITDHWGIPHIYAQTETDLFFAQGYQAAKDRLFQFEIFRRRATGTLSEVLGKRELKRDIGARLFKYRGNINEELNHYHPRGAGIIQSFVNGVNAYIKQVLDNKMPTPIELKLLGIKPGYWTTEVVISRHNGLLSNVQEELQTARLQLTIGETLLRSIANYHPHSPNLEIDPVIDAERLKDDVLQYYNELRAPLTFKPEDISIANRTTNLADWLSSRVPNNIANRNDAEGSNNWVVSGKKMQNGFPLLANDPHRAITVPSLRYIVHLSAPGWNVIGGGEPILPGVSIGHNETGAWGLTIFSTDAEDLYVYKLQKDNPSAYYYKGEWKSFKPIKDTIKVKNQSPEIITLFFSEHGPVTFIDSIHNIGYAVKCGWLEKGCAPYLASLRMNQAISWSQFRDACSYSFIPGENMVWADRQGHIGWQTVGIAPIREHHSGMVPVPGDGRYEWAGYLPVLQRPFSNDPAEGFIVTANENRTNADYPFMNTIGYSWADPYRHDRIRDVLNTTKKFTVSDMMKLQTDYYSIPAKEFVSLLREVDSADTTIQKMKQALMQWDFFLSSQSTEATLFVEWEKWLEKKMIQKLNLDTITNPAINISTKRLIELLGKPNFIIGEHFIQTRDSILIESLRNAILELTKKLGAYPTNWQYGQQTMKHVLIKHPLSSLVQESVTSLLNIGPSARGGNGNTVNSTGDGLAQIHGASFRIIIDCADWDKAFTINSPGQSGAPQNQHYRDLFKLWKKDQYFPLYFSKSKIQSVREHRVWLLPKTR